MVNLYLLRTEQSPIFPNHAPRRFHEHAWRASYQVTVWRRYFNHAPSYSSYCLIMIRLDERLKPVRLYHCIVIYKGDNVSGGSRYPLIIGLRSVIALPSQAHTDHVRKLCNYLLTLIVG